jgi:hypothetical protein
MLPFLGSEALAAGVMSRGALRWNYSPVHPNVYLPNDAPRDLYVKAVAAWLWSRRTGILAGKTAAALHGVDWIKDTEPIELIARHGRRRPGVVVYQEQIGVAEVRNMGDLRVTTPARTALDLARRLPRDEALEHLDALAAKTGVAVADIGPLEERYRATRGIRAAREVIGLMDAGSVSQHQTRLRLLLLDAGLPRPRTSIRLRDPLWEAALAIGWDEPKVGIEHEDDLKMLNPVQRIARDELFQRLGWFRVLATNNHPKSAIVRRVCAAIAQRG